MKTLNQIAKEAADEYLSTPDIMPGNFHSELTRIVEDACEEYTETKFIIFSENMVVYAFRYCLGRKTGAVWECAGYLIKFWPKLSPYTREQICREIRYAIEQGEAGDQCDIDEWNRVLNLRYEI